jgi:hypothetical protein
MSFLRNIGGILARHYEKVIVVFALIGFIGAVVYLYGVRQAEEAKIQEFDRNVQKKKGKEVPSVDLQQFADALQKAKNPPALDFGLPHNLFNPVKWQKKPGGEVIKIETGTEVGGAALKIVNIAPLRTVISIDRATPGGLFMSAIQEASTNLYYRRKIQSYVTTNAQHSTKLFTVRDIRGGPEKPEVLVELADGKKVTVTPDKPYSEVEGYKADLHYPPENRNFKDVRVGARLTLGGEDYIIVAITENEVVVSAVSNNRRATIRK